jgi:hypothetical protein
MTGWQMILTRAEANDLLEAIDHESKRRVEEMPDERSAVLRMFDGWLRLKELGWNEAQYCPKDGSSFLVIEPGSTGFHRCHYTGEWPDGHWWVEDEGDLWPASPILWKPL